MAAFARTVLASLLAFPASASTLELDGRVDEGSIEWDGSGAPVRASGEFGLEGRFTLKLPRSEEPVAHGTVSLDVEGFPGSLKGTFEQRCLPGLRDDSGAPLPRDPASEAASLAFFEALRPTWSQGELLALLICSTSTGFSDEYVEFCRQLQRTAGFPHTLPGSIASIPSRFQLDALDQALFGCGPLWGTDCADVGIDLFRSDLETLLYFLPGGRGAGTTELGAAALDPVLAAAWAFFEALVARGADDRFGSGPCGLETPEHCLEIRKVLDQVASPVGGPGPRRWLWETGGRFRVDDARGSLAQYRDGSVYASEPYLHSSGEARVRFALVPEPAARLAGPVGLAAVLAVARCYRRSAGRRQPCAWRAPGR